MYSLNVPVPGVVHDLARSLRPALVGFEWVRPARTRTLVVKRLPADDRREYLTAERRVRRALAGAPTVEARIDGVGVFPDPPNGSGPVAYLAVESPGLERIHRRVTEDLEPVPEMEGDAYTPHVTLARDGDRRAVERLREATVESVTWTIDALEFYDAEHGERIERVPLPA